MQSISNHKALAAAVSAAEAAGALMRKNLRAEKKANAIKSHDIKLELDVRSQKLIERKLRAVFPDVALLGEEGNSGAVEGDYRWVVDPIDGTVNFAYGIPHACVSIALQQRVAEVHDLKQRTSHGIFQSVVGVVYDPFQDEIWTAVRGQKAKLNGKVIHVSNRRQLRDCIVSIGFAKSRDSLERALPYFIWLARRVRKIRMLGAAALGLTYVATGRLDGYIERGISLWDVAAGGLIVECAGGKFTLEETSGEYKYRMISSNGLIHKRLPRPE